MRRSITRFWPGLAFLLLAPTSLPLLASTLTVSNTNDTGAGSLRGAIMSAAAGDTIVFAVALDGATISLTTYSNDLGCITINATTCATSGQTPGTEFGPSAFFINGNQAVIIDATAGLTKGVVIARDTTASDYGVDVTTPPNFRLFDVETGSSLTLRGVTLSNGYAAGGGFQDGGGALGAGGAIFNQGTLVLDRCTLTGNTALGGTFLHVSDQYEGGAGVGQTVYDLGTAGGAPGAAGELGGGPNAGGTSDRANPGTGYSGGFGGGGGSGGANSGGSGGFGGGGAYIGGGGGFGGGGADGFGVAGFGGGGGQFGGAGAGMGGAIFNDAGTVALTNVTINGNAANGGSDEDGAPGSGLGGALFNYNGSLTLDFVTLSGNSVSTDGMDIYTLGDSAVACSAGGNPCLAPGASLPSSGAILTINHSVAASTQGGTYGVILDLLDSINGSSTVAGANNLLALTPQAKTGTSIPAGTYGATTVASLKLASLSTPLAGGLLDVLIPQTGSAAIDATTCDTTAIDQRGLARPQGTTCDVGAVEVFERPGGLCYVWATASGINDGSSWTNAYTDLQSALSDPTCTTVWVAKGVYKPISGTDQTISFNVQPGIKVYGGFAGTEPLLTDRTNIAGNPTVLSGDIDDNDSVDANGVDQTVDTAHNSGNSYTVVMMNGTTTAGSVDTDTVLDGFIITAGNNLGGSGLGGGFYCSGINSGHKCNPMLSNVTFSGNNAQRGGAMYNDGGDIDGSGGGTSSPVLNNAVFSGNSAQYGGAIYNSGGDHSGGGGGTSSPMLNNVTFSSNSAQYGGAMFDDGSTGGTGGSSSPMLSKVTFSGNSATAEGGAMYNSGGFSGNSSPGLSNVTFNGNSATTHGGAMVNFGYLGTSGPTLSNVTFSGNTQTDPGSDCGGAALYDFFSFPILKNVIVWGNTSAVNASANAEICNANQGPPNTGTPSFTNSVVQGSGGSSAWDPNWGTDNGGNIDADPVLGALQNNGGTTQTMLPGTDSSAIDHGDAATCSAAPVSGLDQRGIARPQGSACDIGAVEVLQFSVGGSASGQTGSVILQLDGTSPVSTQQWTVGAADSSFVFATTLPPGANWSVTVTSAPAGQLCTVTPASGSAIAANVSNLVLTCVTVSVTITPTSLPDSTYGTFYSQSLSASSSNGGTAPYTFTVTSGSLPTGLMLSSMGTFSGTPAAGSASFTVTATSTNGFSGTQSYTFNIGKADQMITFGTAPTPTYSPGGSFTVSASATSSLQVAFTTTTSSICTVGASSGTSPSTATVTILSAGTCIIAADQPGDGNNNPAATVMQNITIAQDATTLTLTATPKPSVINTPVTITATVAGDPPTGTVTFCDGAATSGPSCPGTTLCPAVTLTAGTTNSTATCSYSFTTLGTHTLSAYYAGDGNYNATATTQAVVESVDPVSVPVPAPMLGRWALLLLGGLMSLIALARARRT